MATAAAAAATAAGEKTQPSTPTMGVKAEEKKQAVPLPAGKKAHGSSGRWSSAEDESLKLAVKEIGPRNWKRIASEYLADTRTDVQCLHRWQKVLRPGLHKGPWFEEEDNTIRRCMAQGITRWSEIAKLVPGRIGKQCRERWFNHLDPTIKKTEWTEEEDRKLIEGQAALGNKWSMIAKLYLPGRPENAVKNRWNAATRRRKTGEAAGDRKRKAPRKTSPRPAKAAKGANKTATANLAGIGGPGMTSLDSLCAVALASPPNKGKGKKATKAEKAAEKAKKKAKKAAARAKKAAAKLAKQQKKVLNSELVAMAAREAAAALAAAAQQVEGSAAGKRTSSRRNSSFRASRPELNAPSQIKTVKGNKEGGAVATPLWKSPTGGDAPAISPGTGKPASGEKEASALSALQFLSAVSAVKAPTTRSASKAMDTSS